MSRRDRLRQGAEAKERVLSGAYNQPRQSETTSSRRDRLKSPEDVAKTEVSRKQQEDADYRAQFPTAFDPIAMKEAISTNLNNLRKPEVFGPPAPSGLQQRAAVNAQLPGRDIPVIGSILKGIDKLQEFTEPAAKVAEQYYTPGAGLTAIGGFTNATGSLISKVAPKLGMGSGIGAAIGREAIKEGAVGVPLGFGQSLASNPRGGLGEAAKQGAIGGAIGLGGGAVLAGLGRGVGALYNRMRSNNVPEDVIQEMLTLPAPSQRGNVNRASTPDVITPEYTFELPAPNMAGPTTGRVAQQSNPHRQQFEMLMQRAQKMQQEGHFTPGREMEELDSLWSQMAGRDGVSLDELIQLANPTRTSRITPDLVQRARVNQSSREVAGAPLPFQTRADRLINRQGVMGSVEPPVERVGRSPEVKTSNPSQVTEILPAQPEPVRPRTEVNPSLTEGQRQSGSIQTSFPKSLGRNANVRPSQSDVLRFGNTVRDSQQTPKALSDLLADNPLTGHRTSDKLNHEQATKLIEKNGIEGTTSRLLAKKGRLTPPEVTAAQMLAKHYSNLGGDENLQKSIEIISKTAREGREMGQAIQALSMWNKLDQEGALLLAERQLNRGVTDTSEWTKLTVEQAKPVQGAAKKIEEVQEARTLADQIVKMLADKPPGSALTDAEKSLIKQFEQQVKQVNETVKPFMKKAQSEQDKVIKEVSNIQPKDRTRDQVVDFLEAKAAKAQARINRSRNIGFADIDRGNIVVDLSIIGASKVAKGVVRAADFAEQMVRQFGDNVKPYMNEAFVKATNIFRRENGIPTDAELNRVVTAAIKQNKLDDETANSLRAMAAEIGFYLDNNLKKEAIQDLQLSMKSLGTSTLGEKTATLQTVAQLLSLPTFLRNALGNVGQIVLEKANKLNAVPIDWTVSKFTGERTIKFMPNNQEKFWSNFAQGTASGWKGVSPTGTLSSYDIHPNVFGEKNPLKYLTKTLGASLQGMDYAAYKLAYGDTVATYAEQIGKAQGLTRSQIKQQMPQLIAQLDQRILDMADQAGLYATYQDETMLSLAAQGIKRSLNSITDKPVRALVDKGVLPKWASTEGFGLGDIVLKYARTPANLVMRGIDYSPIGFMRGVYELAPLFINRGKFDQAKAVRALSRAITGTVGLTGIGYALADVGVLTGAASADADMRSIQEQSGQGAYKVNWSALGRYLTSGFDKEAAKHQKGDMMMDYAWAQPAAISLGMGVNANQIIKNQKPGDEKQGFELGFQSVIGGLRTVLENPMVSGLSNVVDATTSLIKRSSSDGFANIVKGVPASFVPAAVGQARSATDNLQRETFDDNVFKTMMNLVKNKVPGLSKTLPVSYDSLGNKRERIQGGTANTLGQYLNSFVNPTKITTYSASPEAKMVLDVLNDSQDPTVLPRIGQKYLMVDDPLTKENRRIDLTKEQFSKLQQRMGELVAEELRKNEIYLSNQNQKIDKRVDKIKDILTKVGTKARNEVRVEMGYKKKK